MKPPRWKMWQGVYIYKGSGVPVFKIPVSGGLFNNNMSQFVSRKQKVTGIYRKNGKLY